MFDKSSTWQRFKGDRPQTLRVHLGYVPALDNDEGEAKKRLRIAVALAIALHLALFLAHVPQMGGAPIRIGSEPDVYVVQQVRFKPPPPQQQQQIPKQTQKKKKIPIPDPTPDEPEPIIVEAVNVPETDLVGIEDAIFGVPEGAVGLGDYGSGPMKVGGAVLPPQKIYAPQPLYTEEARQGRIQGVVILEAIIDAKGNVREVKILKGLPMGLSESAVETARQWRFKPATKEGKPVAVYFNLTVRFSLQ